MNAKTCFDILCISGDATLEEAKRSYKHLVKRWHPDQYGNDPERQRIAHEKLKEINVAYREVVTYLKKSPGASLPSAQPNAGKGKSSGSGLKITKKTSFLTRMSSFFKIRPFDSVHGENPKTQRHPGAVGTRENAYGAGGRGKTAPDFSQVLKRTIHNQPRGFAAGRRTAARLNKSCRKRYHQPTGGVVNYGTFSPPRRNWDDRIEKIEKVKPVRRVGKIGE